MRSLVLLLSLLGTASSAPRWVKLWSKAAGGSNTAPDWKTATYDNSEPIDGVMLRFHGSEQAASGRWTGTLPSTLVFSLPPSLNSAYDLSNLLKECMGQGRTASKCKMDQAHGTSSDAFYTLEIGSPEQNHAHWAFKITVTNAGRRYAGDIYLGYESQVSNAQFSTVSIWGSVAPTDPDLENAPAACVKPDGPNQYWESDPRVAGVLCSQLTVKTKALDDAWCRSKASNTKVYADEYHVGASRNPLLNAPFTDPVLSEGAKCRLCPPLDAVDDESTLEAMLSRGHYWTTCTQASDSEDLVHGGAEKCSDVDESVREAAAAFCGVGQTWGSCNPNEKTQPYCVDCAAPSRVAFVDTTEGDIEVWDSDNEELKTVSRASDDAEGLTLPQQHTSNGVDGVDGVCNVAVCPVLAATAVGACQAGHYTDTILDPDDDDFGACGCVRCDPAPTGWYYTGNGGYFPNTCARTQMSESEYAQVAQLTTTLTSIDGNVLDAEQASEATQAAVDALVDARNAARTKDEASWEEQVATLSVLTTLAQDNHASVLALMTKLDNADLELQELAAANQGATATLNAIAQGASPSLLRIVEATLTDLQNRVSSLLGRSAQSRRALEVQVRRLGTQRREGTLRHFLRRASMF